MNTYKNVENLRTREQELRTKAIVRIMIFLALVATVIGVTAAIFYNFGVVPSVIGCIATMTLIYFCFAIYDDTMKGRW